MQAGSLRLAYIQDKRRFNSLTGDLSAIAHYQIPTCSCHRTKGRNKFTTEEKEYLQLIVDNAIYEQELVCDYADCLTLMYSIKDKIDDL